MCSHARGFTALAGLLAVFSSSHAAAQYRDHRYSPWYGWPGGFVAGGRGGTNAALFDPRYTLTAGYQVMTGGQGMQLGLRAVLGYASFRGNADAYRQAMHLGGGTAVEGGGASVIEQGGDLVLADKSGPLVLHGFYGLRYFEQSRGETRVENGLAMDTLRYRYRQDLGRSFGFGATLQMSTGGGAFAEWYRTQPYDRSMIRQTGLRFGLSWTH